MRPACTGTEAVPPWLRQHELQEELQPAVYERNRSVQEQSSLHYQHRSRQQKGEEEARGGVSGRRRVSGRRVRQVRVRTKLGQEVLRRGEEGVRHGRYPLLRQQGGRGEVLHRLNVQERDLQRVRDVPVRQKQGLRVKYMRQRRLQEYEAAEVGCVRRRLRLQQQRLRA